MADERCLILPIGAGPDEGKYVAEVDGAGLVVIGCAVEA